LQDRLFENLDSVAAFVLDRAGQPKEIRWETKRLNFDALRSDAPGLYFTVTYVGNVAWFYLGASPASLTGDCNVFGSLDIRAGEIVGVAGVEGNGQTELIEALTGLRRVESGSMVLSGKDIANASIRERNESGLAHIPEDRQKRGLVIDYTLEENFILKNHRDEPYSSGGFLHADAIRAHADKVIAAFDVRSGEGAVSKVRDMSGGNQQKAIIGRVEKTTARIRFVAVVFQDEVLFERVVEDKAALLAVLRDVRQTTFVALADRRVGDVLAGEHHAARFNAAQAGQRLDEFRLSVALDASDADDLAGADVERAKDVAISGQASGGCAQVKPRDVANIGDGKVQARGIRAQRVKIQTLGFPTDFLGLAGTVEYKSRDGIQVFKEPVLQRRGQLPDGQAQRKPVNQQAVGWGVTAPWCSLAGYYIGTRPEKGVSRDRWRCAA
jgi:ABC-type branched-subunit amino acid transport system ATPase component